MLMYGRNQQYCKTIIHQLKNKTKKGQNKTQYPKSSSWFFKASQAQASASMPAFPCSFLANVVPALTDSSVTVPLASRPVPPPGLYARCVHL